MPIAAVVTRIDQILTMERSLVDPSSAPTPAGTAASSSAAAAGGASASFASALASAQGMVAPATPGLAGVAAPGLAGVAGSGAGASGLPAPVQAMLQEANALVGKPYVYGGGHSGWAPQAGYDCSGFVSAVLHAGGYLSSPQDTVSLPSAPGIEPGPGQYVTIYDRAQPGQSGHVIIEIAGQFYESGGMHGPWGGGGGVERIAQPSPAYLATFPNVLHPAGL